MKKNIIIMVIVILLTTSLLTFAYIKNKKYTEWNWNIIDSMFCAVRWERYIRIFYGKDTCLDGSVKFWCISSTHLSDYWCYK